MDYAVSIENLSKSFRGYHDNRPATFKDALLHGIRQLGPRERFWALTDVSFKVKPGRMVGVIGPNGAGKSTLLRLMGGVGRPDSGRVAVEGRIGALLDLGTGFHPDFTGRENIFISGVISGLTRAEVAQRFDSIVAFAELEQFIDSPLRTYSTGMQMRLAFAVAAHIDPDILLIDEVLAVGDMAFQQKCLDRIARFKEDGRTIILVSHDVSSVQELCDDVLWLRRGRLAAYGPAETVVEQYVAEMTAETRRRTPTDRSPSYTGLGAELRVNENRFGSLEMEISGVRLLAQDGGAVSDLEADESLQVVIDYSAPQPIDAPIFGVTISREDGFVCYDTSTISAGITLSQVQGSGQVTLHLDRLDLNGGQYYVDVGVYEKDWAYAYDYHWHVYPLQLQPVGHDKSILRPPHHWEIDSGPAMQAKLPSLAVSGYE